MERYDAEKEIVEEITVLGKPVLFTSIRIDRSMVPEEASGERKHRDIGI